MLTLMQQQEPGRRWEGAKEGGRVPKQQGMGERSAKYGPEHRCGRVRRGGLRNGGSQ